MSIQEAVSHLINSSGFKIFALSNPPEGTKYRLFKANFLNGIVSKSECIKMLKDFDYSINNSCEVSLPPKGNIKIYSLY